jgi:hypothetical protein
VISEWHRSSLPAEQGRIRHRYSRWYRVTVEPVRKITVEVPPELLKKAQMVSGGGITETVRTGLQLVAASHAYARLRDLRGKVHFTLTAAKLKQDR